MAEFKYDGFISYSTEADSDLAPRLQDGLEQLAKPWTKRRALKIFQDIDDLAANPDLETTLRSELEQSNTMVFLASEQSAASKWCGDELDYWISERRPEQLVVVLTSGTLEFDKDSDHPTQFERSTSAPPAFAKLTSVPLYIDMRYPGRDVSELDHRLDPDFRAKLTKISAVLHTNATGTTVEPRDIDSVDLAEHRKGRRFRRIAATLLAILTVVAVGAAFVADRQRRTAERLGREAESRALAANADAVRDRDPELAALLALEARSVDATPESVRAMYESAIFPWRRTLLESIDSFTRLDISDDGTLGLVTGTIDGSSDDALIWDLTSDEEVERLRDVNAWDGAISSDGSRYVTAGPDGATVWNADGTRLRQLRGGIVRAVAFSPEGTRIATAADDGLELWDRDGLIQGQLSSEQYLFVEFNADGSQLVAGPDAAGRAVIWNLADTTSSALVAPLGTDEFAGFDAVTSAAFSPDGTRVVTTAGADVHVFTVADGSYLETLATDPAIRNQAGLVLNSVDSVGFDRAGRVVSTGFQGTKVWNLATGASTTLPARSSTQLSVNPSGTHMVTSGSSNPELWELAGDTSTVVPLDREAMAEGAPTAQLAAAGNRLVTVSRVGIGSKVSVWEADGRTVWSELQFDFWSAQLDRSGSRLVLADQFGVRVVDLDDDEPSNSMDLLAESGDPVSLSGSPAFDDRQERLAIPTFDGIEMWDFAGDSPVRLSTVPLGKVEHVALDASGTRIATLTDFDGLVVWDMDGVEIERITEDEVWSIAFDDDDDNVITTSSRGVERWGVDGEPGAETLLAQPVVAFDANADSTQFVTAGAGLGSVVWDADGNQLATLDRAESSSAAFSEDGRTILTSSAAGVQVWRSWTDPELQAELQERVGDRTFVDQECLLYSIDPCPDSDATATGGAGSD